MHFGVIITLALQYSVTLEVQTKYNYTYLKGILTFISSAYLPRTSQGACNFTKMMSLFVRDDCKRKTKQPPGLTFSSKKKKKETTAQWSISSFSGLVSPLALPESPSSTCRSISILSTRFPSGFLKAILWLPSGLHVHFLPMEKRTWRGGWHVVVGYPSVGWKEGWWAILGLEAWSWTSAENKMASQDLILPGDRVFCTHTEVQMCGGTSSNQEKFVWTCGPILVAPHGQMMKSQLQSHGLQLPFLQLPSWPHEFWMLQLKPGGKRKSDAAHGIKLYRFVAQKGQGPWLRPQDLFAVLLSSFLWVVCSVEKSFM